MGAAGLRPKEPVLLVGGPPCTPFSKSGFWLEQKRESRDPNASLLDEYVRVVREARPEAFILENVQGLTYKTHKAQFDRLLRGLGDLGYNPQWRVLLAADYGFAKADLEAIETKARADVDEAIAFARQSPDPKPEDALTAVFA